jgi:hypothetical protein
MFALVRAMGSTNNECRPKAAFDYLGHISTKRQGFTKVYAFILAEVSSAESHARI